MAKADEPAEALCLLSVECEGGPQTLMYYVYILKSLKVPTQFYIGVTKDLNRRISEHATATKYRHTYRYAPWKLETHIIFSDLQKAKAFESYLKTGSGRSFLKKRLV
jgi:predicted GIY-YIG superfamily endonuclease